MITALFISMKGIKGMNFVSQDYSFKFGAIVEKNVGSISFGDVTTSIEDTSIDMNSLNDIEIYYSKEDGIYKCMINTNFPDDTEYTEKYFCRLLYAFEKYLDTVGFDYNALKPTIKANTMKILDRLVLGLDLSGTLDEIYTILYSFYLGV